MVMSIVWLVVGLVLILGGANFLTDGASAVARRFGVSDLVIGLTVVALGTSTPELSISILAAIQGNAPLAVGNVVGSNICNILLIIGMTALIRPIKIERNIMNNEIPIVVLSSIIVWVMGNRLLLDGEPNVVTRVEGIFLLIFFLLFMRYTFASTKIQAKLTLPENSKEDPLQVQAKNRAEGVKMLRSVIYIVGGLAALIWGGDKFVDGASDIAKSLGVSEAMIGLTIVAVGTSLPELATSVVAAIKNNPGLAIGNVIGSNVLNVLLILGAASVISPLPFQGVTQVDLGVLVGCSVLFWAFGWLFGNRVINRWEGGAMTAAYIAYIVFLVMTA